MRVNNKNGVNRKFGLLPLAAALSGLMSMQACSEPADQPMTGQEITTALGLGIMFEPQLGQGPDETLSDPYELIYGDEIENAGFDSVRIRIDMDHFIASSGGAPAYQLSSEFMSDLQIIVDDLLSRHNDEMAVLISPKGLEDGSQLSLEKQVAWWGQIADHFQDHSHRLVFNLMNEPRASAGAGEFSSKQEIQDLYQALTTRIRQTNPTRYIVYYHLYETFDGPGETDFHTFPLVDGAAPYAIVDMHVLGDPDVEGEAKRMGKLRAAWEFRELTGIPVWSGAWQMGSHTNGHDFALGQRVIDEFVARGIPGTYLMFNGGATSIYDSLGLDRDNDGINYEWTVPQARDIVTSAADIVWDKDATYATTSYRAQDDSYVSSSAPTAIKGLTADLHVKNSKTTYLKFPVSRLDNEQINQATLKLLVTSAAGTSNIAVHPVSDNNWDEYGLTYDNAPSIGPAVSYTQVGPADVGNWVELDVTAAMAGNNTVTLALSTADGNLIKFHSRDGAFTGNPDLIVTTDVPAPVSQELINEGFESGSFASHWSVSQKVSINFSSSSEGSNSMALKQTAEAVANFSTLGSDTLTLDYSAKTIGLDNNEFLTVSYSLDNSNWTQLDAVKPSNWQSFTQLLPSAVDDQPNVWVKFSTASNKTNEKALVDGIVITANK